MKDQPSADDDERRRLAALASYQILDTPPEPAFDRVTALAARLFEVPIALVVLIDEHRQWFKSRHGLPLLQMPRQVSFCTRAIAGDSVLVVEDAAGDPQWRDHPLVVSEPFVRFYAGAPLRTLDGFNLGTLCVLDSRPRTIDQRDRDLLATLARVVVDELEARRGSTPAAASDLEEADPRLQAFANQLPAVMWTTDRELRITSGFGAALTRLGPRARGLNGLPLAQYFGVGPVLDRVERAHRRALAGERVTYRIEWENLTFHSQVGPLRDAGGAVVGVLGLALDISERIEVERERDEMREQVSRSERLASVGALAAAVAHEIANPLTFVIGGTRLACRELSEEPPSPASAQRALAALQDVDMGLERVRQITRDLRGFARGEAERPGRPSDPVHAVESALRMARPRIRGVARLETDLAPVATVPLDEIRLAQVVLNLLLNAAQAIPAGGSEEHCIRVAIRGCGDESDGAVEIEVSDTGTGIPEDALPHIFDPFFTTKPVGIGTGLGLAVVRRIVDQVGGTIEVDSRVGQGTRFRVRLPAVPDLSSVPPLAIGADPD